MSNMKIVSRWDSTKILYQAEAESFSALVTAAIKAGADLSGANLRSADLSGADLRSADLRSADLSGADLSSADLSGANLRSANLYGANLYGADLRSADLSGANLYGANLRSAKNISPLIAAQTLVVPEGPFFAWKKCRDNVIVRLFIPSKARRSNATGRKCRAERAKVLAVFGAADNIGISQHNPKVVYKVGQWVHADNWNEDRWTECGGGIHFFITREEAENY